MAACLAVGRSGCCAVPGDNAPLATAVQDGVDGDDLVRLQSANLVGHAVHLDWAAARGGGARCRA